MQEQRESELKLLLSQLSPHFLFNTLNNIYGISITEHHRVPQLLLKLSELLRYSVYETRQRFISLHDELIYINNYIDFERIHIGDKLILLMDINNIEDNHIKIAPMLLIVFVENAFKHSKNSLAENIYIEISLQVRADWIHFAVKNSYRAAEKEDYRLNEPYGIGLHHTLKRLDLIYGQNYRYDTKKENGVYSIGLKLKVS